jgi:UDP-3-O-[3-hydroxymyristoyl] N-acetylglucosamine deacetylase / 3-hydroxyacyl-[acyl-carrier-protein] dehydratase
MTAPRQQTIAEAGTIEGIGLHSGQKARLRLLPAAAGQGVRFRRTDVEGSPEVPALLEHVAGTDRGTSLSKGGATVHTVEHLLAAVGALQIDNLTIEIAGPEVPIGDGSFRPFVDVLLGCGLRALDADAKVIALKAPVSAEAAGGASYAAVPSPSMVLSATIEFDHPLVRRQFGSYEVTPQRFADELAGARTFGFVREADSLRARGLVQGVSLENAIILNETGIESGELRYADEFVRHKIGDVVGDLALLGCRLSAHVIATRPSHAGNMALAAALHEAWQRQTGNTPIVDIQKILQHLPHRYPMLLVDRVVEFESGRRIVGIKNVTINEPFFQGHYPGHPIMPGVLIIEAMAQVGGLLMMDSIEDIESKVVYFMSLDSVKWRRPVTPGDQIRFELEMLQMRRHVCRMKGVGIVDGQVVAEAEMMARIVDR